MEKGLKGRQVIADAACSNLWEKVELELALIDRTETLELASLSITSDIGLIKRIMPESIIIDCRRDPRDTAISAYRQLFNARNEFSASFDSIYQHYQGYLAMINHWRSAYPDQIKVLNYEQLVTSPDEEIPALLDFCGLESEPGCLEFYNQKRAVTTPSVSGVTQPMYTSSIGQWHRFEEYLRDDMSRLGSLLEVK